MEILSVETFGLEELLSALRRVPLRGFGGVLVYKHATLTLESERDPLSVSPCQRYVLRERIRHLVELRDALLGHGLDIMALDGGAYIRTSEQPHERIPIIPPVIEESIEAGGQTAWLINDGIHRVATAQHLGLKPSMVVIRNVPRDYPYYAYPLRDGWEDVTELDELPDVFEKKKYRDPANYKSLFRDFNAVFPGLQSERKASNPTYLHP